MAPIPSYSPRHVLQVMVSSSFADLKEHREALIAAINKFKFHANVMENDDARFVDVIDSSLQMVRDSAVYIGLIGSRYGQIPKCERRNPDEVSLTELEFSEAQRLERPILLFIMGDSHPVTKADVEVDPDNRSKLDAFRERAKKISLNSSVNRVYAVFNSLEEFKDKIGPSLAEMVRYLLSLPDGDAFSIARTEDALSLIPKPPTLYAQPPYIGSHAFVGRDAQLQQLSDWAKPADPPALLLFEAIGGSGKSMLTWEWTTNPVHALAARTGADAWAGRFWYSFYERGAVMSDFCQHALAYMTGRPLRDFRKKTGDGSQGLAPCATARPALALYSRRTGAHSGRLPSDRRGRIGRRGREPAHRRDR